MHSPAAPAPTLQLATQPAVALGGRALLLPALDLLLIADLHLGKGDVFRRAGVALPRGGTGEDLSRLDALLGDTGAGRLLILGDVLHGAANAAAWGRTWQAWREAHPRLRVQAVHGNHDRALAGAGLGIELLGEVHREAGLLFRHDPQPDARDYVLAGHLHPVLRMRGIGPRARLPAFWFREDLRLGVLPAFSAFTGGAEFVPAQRDRVVVCAGESAVVLPGTRGGPPRSG